MYKPFLVLALMFVASNALADVDLVKVDKSDRRMYLMDGGNVVKEYRIALGADPQGHKVQEGDEKTPEGTYVLDYLKLDSTAYKAMHISYPNVTVQTPHRFQAVCGRILHIGTS